MNSVNAYRVDEVSRVYIIELKTANKTLSSG